MATAVKIPNTGRTVGKVKITQVGNSLGIVLPREMLAELNVDKGDSLHLVKHPDGFILSAYDDEFAKKMEAIRYVMNKHRDVLRMLAE